MDAGHSAIGRAILHAMANTTVNEDLTGKVALVTGATTGIGKEIARGLARMGAEVIIGARGLDRGNAARDDITKTSGNVKVSVMQIDVADLKSIRSFASSFLATHPKLHILVNNAGVWLSERKESPDGHELTFATNVLGPYLLTELLAPALEAAAPSRVVNVVSSIAKNYDPADLEFTKRKFDAMKAYAQSKQAFRMVTWGQAERFANSKVTVNCAAPGFVKTEFNRNVSGFMAMMVNFFAALMAVTPERGAETPLWVAAARELEGQTAKYYDKRREQDGKFREPEPIAQLMRECERMTAS
jgi:NAD(P)-dependent dehydrogenase (short-subunit alcohol dehydrogenase family)